MQEPQSLGRDLIDEKIDACRVTAWPGKAGDKTKVYRIFGETEDDWDRRCCSFSRERGGRATGRDDHGHFSTNQIGHQCRQAIVIAVQPVVVHRYILAFDVASFVEAFAECGHSTHVGAGRSAANDADHGRSWPLCTRGEWPSCRRATEHEDKSSPSKIDCHWTASRWGHADRGAENNTTPEYRVGDVLHAARGRMKGVCSWCPGYALYNPTFELPFRLSQIPAVIQTKIGVVPSLG